MTDRPDNRVVIPFGVTVKCRQCKVDIAHGQIAYNDGQGYLYCAEHNPKRQVGPGETKEPEYAHATGGKIRGQRKTR